jgi:mannose-6-phosphate isomerase-like protein (cupin superfamily)
MSMEWKPDDAFLEKEREPGLSHVKAILDRNHLNLDEIVTSRTPGWDQAQYELRREHMPPGWETWQLPLFLVGRPTFFFISACAPGAVLPKHQHNVDQVRIVLSGGMIYNGLELKSGDWMYIPKGKDYTLHASLNPGGCTIMYAY